ncbi:MAG: hypothetical protein ACRD3L_02335 [Terriglobales bacterium]
MPSSSAAQPPSIAFSSTAEKDMKGLPALLPQPKGKATLIGGTVFRIDRVRDQLTLNLFGGGKARILFDARTHIYRDGVAASAADLQNGARVYVDTMLAGVDVFAENIRVRTQNATGQGSGQVTSFNAHTGSLILNDPISPQQLRLNVLPTTVILREGKTVSANDLLPGSLVAVVFQADGSGQPTARTISLLASPGSRFVFAGRVVHLDLHLGLLVVSDPRDQKSYEITFDPQTSGVNDNLREGATIEAVTRFDGGRYLASAIKVDSNPN